MKILLISPNSTLGGAEQYLKMVAGHFHKESVEVIILKKTNTTAWKDIKGEVRYKSDRSEGIGILLLFLELLFKKRKKYDLIFTSHVYTTGVVGIFLKLGLLRTTHFVGRESTSIFKRFSGLKLMTYKLFYALGYSKVDLLICQTAFMKEQLLAALPKLSNSTKVEVIPNPINLDEIATRGAMPLDHPLLHKKYIVSAGRLIPEKGYDLLIPAFKALLPSFPDVSLVILGEGKDRELLEQLIATLDLQEKVFLPGFQKNVLPFFKNAEACVVSSRIEGFPNVLLQMMSQNTKVVSTECAGGISDIPGIETLPPKIEEKLTIALRTVLTQDLTKNRKTFDSYLKKRDIRFFIARINNFLHES
ncbi:glycosyltransferase [Spongiimicrobium salis]|uniref:glycosyltransferase n=1 Tax=Spongiimicrobium salis TaxID=1667022 RepID=UPI00374DEFA6